MKRQNLVGHCTEGNSDKIYMLCICVDAEGKYNLLAKWGRRGSAILHSQVKLQTDTGSVAYAEQRRLFEQKEKRGYVDIESSAYTGNLTFEFPQIKNNLEPRTHTDGKPEAPEPEEQPKSKEIIVKCLDNVGLEGYFDNDVEYVGETHASDNDLILVYDKMGELCECFASRFQVMSHGEHKIYNMEKRA